QKRCAGCRPDSQSPSGPPGYPNLWLHLRREIRTARRGTGSHEGWQSEVVHLAQRLRMMRAPELTVIRVSDRNWKKRNWKKPGLTNGLLFDGDADATARGEGEQGAAR